MFPQYATVRVKALLNPSESYNSWGVSRRAPVIGDVGAIVEVRRSPGAPTTYVVECVGTDGVTQWLADFTEMELETCETQ